MPKTGEAWIQSSEKRCLELGITIAATPVLGTIALAAGTAVACTQPDEGVFHRIDRSLFPGDRFTIRKLGDPTSSNKLLKVFRQAMIDELPQAAEILRGTMALVGPRADTPEHVEALFEAIDDAGLRDHWEFVRQSQHPGIISSYAIHSHRRNLEGEPEADRFYTEALRRENAILRAQLDIQDFEQASLPYDVGLLRQTAVMALANYAQYARRITLTA